MLDSQCSETGATLLRYFPVSGNFRAEGTASVVNPMLLFSLVARRSKRQSLEFSFYRKDNGYPDSKAPSPDALTLQIICESRVHLGA